MTTKIIALIKAIVLVGIFYLLLVYNVFDIGETLVPSSKDYLQENTPITEKSLEEIYLQDESTDQTGHFAATSTQEQLDLLCDKIQICDIITFKGTFNIVEKYNYTKIFSKIVEFVDTYTTKNKSIKTVIHEIEITKQNGERRWYATRNSILFNMGLVSSHTEFIQLSTHEIAHITDLWYIQGSTKQKDKKFTEFGRIVFAINDPSLAFYRISRESETIRKASGEQKDFCSGYGMSNPFEDFAECFNLYINHNVLFRQIAKSNTILKKKYNIIASLFAGKYLAANTKDLSLIKNNNARRPRDTTKIN